MACRGTIAVGALAVVAMLAGSLLANVSWAGDPTVLRLGHPCGLMPPAAVQLVISPTTVTVDGRFVEHFDPRQARTPAAVNDFAALLRPVLRAELAHERSVALRAFDPRPVEIAIVADPETPMQFVYEAISAFGREGAPMFSLLILRRSRL
jgi:hypothetical protein